MPNRPVPPAALEPGASGAFDLGQRVARTLIKGLSDQTQLTQEQRDWLSGFAQGLVEIMHVSPSQGSAIQADTVAPNAIVKQAEKAPATRRAPFTARILQTEIVEPAECEPWLTVALDVEGSQFEYAPGSTLAIWPTNDPEEVRKVLRALGVSAQLEVTTASSVEPAWQILLERVDLARPSRQTLQLLAEFARAESEAASLLELSELALDALRGRSLLSLLRRFPSARPPFERLLASLSPLEPTLVPIASSALEQPNCLRFSAGLSETPSAWGQLNVQSRSRLRAGEWLTVSIDQSRPTRLAQDDLTPVVIIAEGPGIAFARSLVAERHARKAKGRNWVAALGLESSSFAYARELSKWHRSGLIGRYDVTRTTHVAAFEQWLETHEETLWRWMVDRSQFCLVTQQPELRRAMERWLLDVFTRRQKLAGAAATQRLQQMLDDQQWVLLPT